MKTSTHILFIFFSIMSYVAMAMDADSALAMLSESKKQFRVKEGKKEFVTRRPVYRTQRLLNEKQSHVQTANGSLLALMSELPPMKQTHQEETSNVLSRAPYVTTRKRTPSASVSAKTLYDKAMFLYPAKAESRLNTSTSIAQKIGFDASIKRGDVNETVSFLKANNGLRTSYPLAIKLYAVMVSEADELIIHPGEAAIIPVRDIYGMAKSLAVLGHNEQFLEKCARMLHEDPEMRKIINGDR